MSLVQDLTFTVFNNSGLSLIFPFTFTVSGGGTKTSTFKLNGVNISPTPSLISNGTTVDVTVPSSASNQTINISGVSTSSGTASITAFSLPANILDNNIKEVATGDPNTWGLGDGEGFPTLTTMAGQFAGAQLLTAVPSNIPSSVLSTANMFDGCIAFNQNLNSWSISNVTNMQSMFNGCSIFNNGGAGSLWNTGGLQSTGSVTNMSSMFSGCVAFNQNIGNWDTSAVTTMQAMFFNANTFNKDIGNWNTSNVTTFQNMFGGSAPAFNGQIKYWTVRSTASFQNMFAYAPGPPAVPGAFYTAYYNVSPTKYGDNSGQVPTQTTPTYDYFGQPRPPDNPCFMKGSLILCLRGEEEVYRPVQDLRKGDLVKTYRNGYLPIHMIGTSSLSNPGDEVRISNRLYKCSKELYPDLFEDLYITGCHSILVPALTNDQWENTKAMLGNVYITDNHFRLMACVDEKAQPYKRDAMIDIYHIALENDDYYMNYGIYANGLLVESCSKRYLTELSNMRIIGEDQACYDAPSVNVFSELGGFVQSC